MEETTPVAPILETPVEETVEEVAAPVLEEETAVEEEAAPEVAEEEATA